MEVQPEPYMEFWRKVLFVVYAVASYIYRWIVTFSILYFLSNWLKPYKLGALSGLLAGAALGSMVGWPLYRLFKGLHRRGRLPDMKRYNVSLTTALLTILVVLFFTVPLPISRVRETGVVQIEPHLVHRVTVPEEGLLTALHVYNGQRVEAGQLLAEFRSPKLEADLQTARGTLQAARATLATIERMRQQATEDEERKALADEWGQANGQKLKAESEANLIHSQIDALKELRAPRAGVVLGAPRPDEVGKLWSKEDPTPFCSVGDPKELRLLVPVGPADYHLLQKDMRDGRRLAVSIRLPGRGSDVVLGQLTRLPESDAQEVPLALTHQAGGPLAVKPGTNPNVHVPQSQQYLVPVEFLQPDPAMCPGTLATAKIHCRWQTCAWWVWHTISKIFDLGLI
jgi:putative peptide zinc metalloprotease protein